MIALLVAEKGLEPERHFVDIRANANYEPGYMALNPKGVVPTWVAGSGEAVCNSPRIAAHLDGIGGPALANRADPEVDRWCQVLEDFPLMHLSYTVWVQGRRGERSATILDDKVARAEAYARRHPALGHLYARKRDFFIAFRDEIADPRAHAAIVESSAATLEALGVRVEATGWVGDQYGFADAIATSILFRLEDLGVLDGWSQTPGHPLLRYLDRLKRRPSFAAVWHHDPLLARLDAPAAVPALD